MEQKANTPRGSNKKQKKLNKYNSTKQLLKLSIVQEASFETEGNKLSVIVTENDSPNSELRNKDNTLVKNRT